MSFQTVTTVIIATEVFGERRHALFLITNVSIKPAVSVCGAKETTSEL